METRAGVVFVRLRPAGSQPSRPQALYQRSQSVQRQTESPRQSQPSGRVDGICEQAYPEEVQNGAVRPATIRRRVRWRHTSEAIEQKIQQEQAAEVQRRNDQVWRQIADTFPINDCIADGTEMRRA